MPPRISEIGIKCLTVTVLQQHGAQSILQHLKGEDWIYELATLEASLSSLNHLFFSNFCYILCCSLDFLNVSLMLHIICYILYCSLDFLNFVTHHILVIDTCTG